MNALKKKSKNIGCTPVDIKNFYEHESPDEKYSLLKEFVHSTSAENQLMILKDILNKFELMDTNVTKLLAVIYLYSPAKHPIKCFLTKYITKSSTHNIFTAALAQEILSRLSLKEYTNFVTLIPKAVLCIENFPAGVASIKQIDKEFAEYLIDCLNCCQKLLNSPSVSPTKKSEIYNLEHCCIRLLVHIIQKLDSEQYPRWSTIFQMVNHHVEIMVDDVDLPMDTKCLCGILYLLIETLGRDEDDFGNIVKNILSTNTLSLLKSRTGKLTVYYALATSLPVKRLLCDVEGKLAIAVLVDKLLEVGESGPSSPAIDIGVARSLVQICRSLRSLPTAPAIHVSDVLLHATCTRLDDHQDCVRHLAATGLQAVIEFCVYVDNVGDPLPLSRVISAISSLRALSRARIAAVRCFVASRPPTMALAQVCTVHDVMEALDVPHLEPAARATLDTLLRSPRVAGDSDALFATWVPAARARGGRSSLIVLTAILALRPDLLDRITALSDFNKVGLLVSARRAGLPWRAHITTEELFAAAVSSDIEVRIQVLSLVVETPKTSEPFTADDISFLKHYLKYNMFAHDINYRQNVVALFKKAIERSSRTGDSSLSSYVVSRCVRDMSHVSATRRAAAAALLLPALQVCLEKDCLEWSEEYVEILLKNLDDSYETNQNVALKALIQCPTDLLQKDIYSSSLKLEDILKQSTSLKPADSLAAAFKLQLLLAKLPHRVKDIGFDTPPYCKEAFTLCSMLNRATVEQMSAAFAPLHCLSAVMRTVDKIVLTSDQKWRFLLEDVLGTCERVLSVAAQVVNNASPEGYLPPSDHDSITVGGRPLSAQMVLLCAWRSVKEASLLLGWLGGLLGGGMAPRAGVLLVGVLRGCQHRGAFEQAASGLTLLLNEMCSVESQCLLPAQWLRELLEHISNADDAELKTTRRSAGLPFLIQGLLSSQPHLASETANKLLALASAPDSALRRVTAINVLCALYKHSSLEGVMAEFIERGLILALNGIDADGWPERTASCLLFSALCVRVFGVVRSKDALDVRNTLPARLFFVRYPHIYDVMLNKLQGALDSDNNMLRPSVYPILLVLGRLRPTLEGTVSTLKVSAFEPLILRCASSAVLKTRQLAAAAAVALLSPDRYLAELKHTFSLLSSQNISTNYCHGLLLRLVKVLQEMPDKGNTVPSDSTGRNNDFGKNGNPGEIDWNKLGKNANSENCDYDKQSNKNVIDNYNTEKESKESVDDNTKNNRKSFDNVKNIDKTKEGKNIEVVRNNIEDTDKVERRNREQEVNEELERNKELEVNNGVENKNGGEIDVKRSTWLLNQPCFILTQEYVRVIHLMLTRCPEHLTQKLRTLISNRVEVIVFDAKTSAVPGLGSSLASCMKLYITLTNGTAQLLFRGLTHVCYEVVLVTLNYIIELQNTGNTKIVDLQRRSEYNDILMKGYYEGKYLECKRKCLLLLTSQRQTQNYVINDINASNEIIVHKLLDKFERSHFSEKHMFLKSLLYYISKGAISSKLHVLKAAYSSCLEESADDVRDVVLDFLEENADDILRVDDLNLGEETFEYTATIYALLVILLEDDDENTRQRASDVTIRIIKSDTDATLSAIPATLSEIPATLSASQTTLSAIKTFETTLSEIKSIIPSFCGELFRFYLSSKQTSMDEKMAYFLIIALLEFKGESCSKDLVSDEYRVFEQSDRSNLYLEDALWTDACAEIIVNYKVNDKNVHMLDIINNKTYARTFQTLCGNNLVVFLELANGQTLDTKINKKVVRFFQKLGLQS